MKKQTLNVVTAVFLVYHLVALIKDAERCAFNARRVRANPSPANVAKLLVAEGVLIADLDSI